jgi:hypothetical protein
MQGLRSPQGLLTRTCTRSRKDLVGTTAPGFPKELLIRCKDPGSLEEFLIIDKDLWKIAANASYRMPAGSSQDLLRRKGTRSCKNL